MSKEHVQSSMLYYKSISESKSGAIGHFLTFLFVYFLFFFVFGKWRTIWKREGMGLEGIIYREL